jgi:hypothetical protein
LQGLPARSENDSRRLCCDIIIISNKLLSVVDADPIISQCAAHAMELKQFFFVRAHVKFKSLADNCVQNILKTHKVINLLDYSKQLFE